jgi:PAS domain S-box-containing protein
MYPRAPLAQGTFLGPEQLSTLLDSVQELLTILSPDGSIQFASAGFTRLLGHGTEDLIGRSILDLIHLNDAEGARECLRELSVSQHGRFGRRCRLRSKDESWRWFEAEAHNYSRQTAIEGIVVSFRDVTDLHRMEAERQVISEIVHALNQTANLDELLRGIHVALKKVVYAENCFVALHDQVADTFTFPFFADQVDVAPAPQKVGRSCTAFVFRTGCPMLIPQNEFDRLAAEGKVELVGSPSPSWLGVPLKTPTATIGVLVVQHYQNENAYDIRDL